MADTDTQEKEKFEEWWNSTPVLNELNQLYKDVAWTAWLKRATFEIQFRKRVLEVVR